MLEAGGHEESSSAVRSRVERARGFAAVRLAHVPQDSDRSLPLEQRENLSAHARMLMRQALVKESLSGRAYSRTIRLARTIADLDGQALVEAEHVMEALTLRLDQRRISFS